MLAKEAVKRDSRRRSGRQNEYGTSFPAQSAVGQSKQVRIAFLGWYGAIRIVVQCRHGCALQQVIVFLLALLSKSLMARNSTLPPPTPRYVLERRTRHNAAQAAYESRRIDSKAPKRDELARAALILIFEHFRARPDSSSAKAARTRVLDILEEVGFERGEAARRFDDGCEAGADDLQRWKRHRQFHAEERRRRSAADKPGS